MSDSPEEVAYSAVAEKWFNGAQGYWVMKYIATAVAASREAGLLAEGDIQYTVYCNPHAVIAANAALTRLWGRYYPGGSMHHV